MSVYYYNWEEVNVNWEALNLNWELLKVSSDVCSWDNININWEALNLNWETICAPVEGCSWDNINIFWNDLNVNWEDVCPAVQVISGGVIWAPNPESLRRYLPKKIQDASTAEVQKRVIIKILAKIEGEEFIEYKYKNRNNIKVSAKDINVIANQILNNIKVNVQNIS